jgi:cytochrome c-type biogenesis protein CcmH/NrfG
VEALNRVLQQNPNFLPAHAYLAVAFTEMGQARRAEEAWAQAQRLSPDASPASLRQRLPYRRPADLDRFLTAVAKLR